MLEDLSGAEIWGISRRAHSLLLSRVDEAAVRQQIESDLRVLGMLGQSSRLNRHQKAWLARNVQLILDEAKAQIQP